MEAYWTGISTGGFLYPLITVSTSQIPGTAQQEFYQVNSEVELQGGTEGCSNDSIHNTHQVLSCFVRYSGEVVGSASLSRPEW